jgi:hypothetical protein
MEKPKITPWVEGNINEVEEFVVFKPTRIDIGDGKGAKAYSKGQPVKVGGNVKKDLYFQNKILYKKDFEAVVAYEKEAKEKFSGSPDALKDSAAASQEALSGKGGKGGK